MRSRLSRTGRDWCSRPQQGRLSLGSRQDVAVSLCTNKNIVSLLSQTLPGCHQAACNWLAERRCKRWSGRWGSNPRQPAWKAGSCTIGARSLYIGLAVGFIRFVCAVSGPDKRCHAHFLGHSAKHFTSFYPRFQHKMLRTSQDRRSHC